MLRKTAVLSVLAAFGLAGSLHADDSDPANSGAGAEHYVVMLGHGYFPASVHPVIGDTILFVNITDIPMAATAEDGSWSTGLLPENAAFILPVTDGMTMAYINGVPQPDGQIEVIESTEDTGATIIAEGIVDYVNPAPVDLNPDGTPSSLPDEAYDNS